MRSLRTTLVTLALGWSVVACGGGSSSATRSGTEPTVGGARTSELHRMCTALIVRARECTDTFIPALVDLRVRLDVPAGIAAEDQAEGREALVARAHEEWKRDSANETIATFCDGAVARTTPEMVEAFKGPAERCLAATDCEAFVPCDLALHEAEFRAAAASR